MNIANSKIGSNMRSTKHISPSLRPDELTIQNSTLKYYLIKVIESYCNSS